MLSKLSNFFDAFLSRLEFAHMPTFRSEHDIDVQRIGRECRHWPLAQGG
jgi:hypothetical protein